MRVRTLALLAALAAGCAEPPVRPLPLPAGPPRAEEVLATLAAEDGDSYWMVPELLEEAAVGVRPDAGGAWVERIDFAGARCDRGRVDRAGLESFLRRVAEAGAATGDAPPPVEGIRVRLATGTDVLERRVPRSSPLAEVFRSLAADVLPERGGPVEGFADRGLVRALETGPVHYEDPVFGPDGAIYAKAAGVHRLDLETGRFLPAFGFPPGVDPHRVQWEVPTRTLLAFQASGIPYEAGASVDAEGRWAAIVRSTGAAWTLERIDLAADRRTAVLQSPRPIADPVVSDDGRWLAFSVLGPEPDGTAGVRVYDAEAGLEFDSGEDDAAEHRPIAWSPRRRTFYVFRREAGEVAYEIYLWSVERREVELGFRYDPAEFQVLAIVPDGRAIARKAFVHPDGPTLWRLGIFDLYTSTFTALSTGDGEGPGSLHPAGDRFVYGQDGDVYLWRGGRPGERP